MVATTIATNIADSISDDTPVSQLPNSVLPTEKLYPLVLAYLGVLETLTEAGMQVTNITNKTIQLTMKRNASERNTSDSHKPKEILKGSETVDFTIKEALS